MVVRHERGRPMHWQFTPYVFPVAASAVVSFAVAVPIWRRRPAPGSLAFSFRMLAMAAYDLWRERLDQYRVVLLVVVCCSDPYLYSHPDVYAFDTPVSWARRYFTDCRLNTVGGEHINSIWLEPIS